MDIELVIKIPEEDWKFLKESNGCRWSRTIIDGVINGTPLPKGHGKLIILSEDAIKREQTSLSFFCQNWISEVGLSNATVATIEADKEDKECKTYCTECPYFNDIIYEGEQWYGARCKKDGHSTKPSMYAIKSLNDDCPLTKDKEDK